MVAGGTRTPDIMIKDKVQACKVKQYWLEAREGT